MCGLLFVYASTVVYRTRQATYYYSGAQVAMSTEQARYLFGPPTASADGGARWDYLADGRQTTLRFDPGGRMASIACASRGSGGFGCGDMLGIRVGMPEDQVTLALGPPDRETYGANTKTIYYDGLGLAFRLRLYLVEEMRLGDSASVPGYLARALWRMVP